MQSGKPKDIIFPIVLKSNLNFTSFKFDFFLRKWLKKNIVDNTCAIPVAKAAPFTPYPNFITKI